MDKRMASNEETIAHLTERAQQARKNAYAPYSSYPVGAALLTRTGEIFVGANVENAAYPTTMCAERSAVFSAVAHGERSFEAIVIVSENGGAPCGACRQVLSEFGPDLEVVTTDADGKAKLNTSLGELIPNAFGPQDLILP
jgi:cytidine deaminase